MPTLGTATLMAYGFTIVHHVGVMCADIGHCDRNDFTTFSTLLVVGVMCADIGHCDL